MEHDTFSHDSERPIPGVSRKIKAKTVSFNSPAKREPATKLRAPIEHFGKEPRMFGRRVRQRHTTTSRIHETRRNATRTTLRPGETTFARAVRLITCGYCFNERLVPASPLFGVWRGVRENLILLRDDFRNLFFVFSLVRQWTHVHTSVYVRTLLETSAHFCGGSCDQFSSPEPDFYRTDQCSQKLVRDTWMNQN